MSKPNSTAEADSKTVATSASKRPNSPNPHPQDATRETFESIAFAFVLALLFRTFVAEAFVIPTGSMAPTLFGRNKDIVCEECHHKYEVGASDELNDDGYLYRRIDRSICPNCRHSNNVRDLNVFKGDRILVNKFPYQVGNPERWDVIVFRYPEDMQKNYIKRLVGLPGETVRISRGDVYVKKSESDPFEIVRKQDPNKQRVLQQLVYDDRKPPVDLLASGWPERWAAMSKSDQDSPLDNWVDDKAGWKHETAPRGFSIEASDQDHWVRYRHFVPHSEDWKDQSNADPSKRRPELVTDFCGYNATYSGDRSYHTDDERYRDDRFWVGDLTLNLTLEIKTVGNPQAELILELNEGVRRYRCRIEVATGKATLFRNDDLAPDSKQTDIEMASASTPIRGAGKYTISFANVDDRLCLWVNSSWLNSGLIPFGKGAEFQPPANRNPQDADLVPAGFSARGMKVYVSDLILQRDIYYRAESVPNDTRSSRHDQEISDTSGIIEALTDPDRYGDLYSRQANEATFGQLGPDEFFVMGDNSPRSQDSRLWPNDRRKAVNRHAVPRQALLGKAFFIYWPHGIPFMNGGKGFTVLSHSTVRDQRGSPVVETYPEYVAPFYPQWWRWKRIR